MKALSISTISLVYLSDNVAYFISSERELLKAYIGFRTKKLGQVWLRPLKKIIGRLSNLKDCRAEEYRHLPKKKWATMNPYKHRQSSKNLYLSLPPNTY